MIELRMILQDLDNSKYVNWFKDVRMIEFGKYGICIHCDNKQIFMSYGAIIDCGVYVNNRCVGHLFGSKKEGE